jgi:hypothetical protein
MPTDFCSVATLVFDLTRPGLHKLADLHDSTTRKYYPIFTERGKPAPVLGKRPHGREFDWD